MLDLEEPIIPNDFCVLRPSSAAATLPPLTVRRSRTTLESSVVSETESHRQLEAELSVIKTRFAGTESRTNAVSPVKSRFQEDFDVDLGPGGLSSPTNRRRSAFARLSKFGVKTLDGPMEKMLGVPLPPSPAKGLRHRKGSHGAPDVNTDSDALGTWGKAVKSVRKDSQAGRKKSVFPDEWRRKNSARGSQKVKNSDDPDENENGTEYDSLMAKKDDIMDDWEKEMEITAKRAKKRSKKVVPKLKLGPDYRYPASWSKFSSHDRAERTERMTSAQSMDSTNRKDFAVHATKDGKTIWYRNEKTHHLHHHDDDECPPDAERGFFKKLEDKILMKLPRQAPKEADIEMDQTYGRRGSLVLSSELEFPELEILPMEMMTSDEIEEHVEAVIQQEEVQKQEDELQRKEDELDAIFGGPRKKPNAIAKARKAAEGIVALQGTDEICLPEDKASKVCLPSEKPQPKKKKLDQFGFEIDEEGDFCLPEEKPIKKKKKKRPDQDDDDDGQAKSPKSKKMEGKTGESPKTKARSSKMDRMTGESPKTPEPAQPAAADEEVMDTAGMNASVMEQQIAARVALKKKMEDAQKKGGNVRRGPVARARPKAEDVTTSERPGSPMGGDGSDVGDEYLFTPKSEISIADPRFYEDCIMESIVVTPPLGEVKESRVFEGIEGLVGGDSVRVKVVEKSGSEDSVQRELREAEGMERERVLSLAAALLEDEKELELSTVESVQQVGEGGEVKEGRERALSVVAELLEKEKELEEGSDDSDVLRVGEKHAVLNTGLTVLEDERALSIAGESIERVLLD